MIDADLGDYYLPDSGRFVCPYDAVYYVSLTDKKDADADTFLEVVRGKIYKPTFTVMIVSMGQKLILYTQTQSKQLAGVQLT